MPIADEREDHDDKYDQQNALCFEFTGRFAGLAHGKQL